MTELMERIPPQSPEAEQSVLGAMLLEREAVETAIALLHEDDFYREGHKLLFVAIRDLFHAGKPADLTILGEELRSRQQLDVIGGTLYLTTIMSAVPSAAGIRRYCHIVRAKSFQRAMIRTADAAIEAGYIADVDDTEKVMSHVEGQFMRLLDAYTQGTGAALQLLYDVEKRVIAARKEADKRGYDIGFKSPLAELNRTLSPFVPGEFVVIAGRPSSGKTSFGLQLAYDACASQGRKGLFISLETTAESLALRRMLASATVSRWNVETLIYRQEHPEVYTELNAAAEESMNVPLLICDTPEMTPNKVLHLSRMAKRQLGGLDFVMVDYLQLMTDDERHRDLRETITAVSKGCRRACMRLPTCVIALAQLNRDAEGQRPTLANLRESGQIEQDATKVIMLHWPKFEEPRSREIGVVKQKDGATKWHTVGFHPRATWFYNSETDVPPEKTEGVPA